MLKIGVQTAVLLKQKGIEDSFALLRDCGFDFVDFSFNALDGSLGSLREKPDPLHGVFDLPLEEIRPWIDPYKAAAEKYGVAFGQTHAPFPTWWPGNDARNDYLIMAFSKMIGLCAYIGCPYIIIHPAKMASPKDDWQANMTLYKALVPALKEHGVICCLENMFTSANGKIIESSCADPYEACDYIDELNDFAGEKRFAFCLDTGHALLTGRDIYTAIMKLGSRLETLHIHDNNGRVDQHFTPYMGVLDWDRFVKGLRDVGYRGGLSFETFVMLSCFDPELADDVMRLIASTGRLFARRIEEGKE